MTVRAAFFDLDGCLVDSRAAIATCINVGLEALGARTRPEADLYRFIGPALHHTFEELLIEDGLDPARSDDAVAAYREAYATVSLERTTAVPGIVAALNALASATRLAIVTSKPTAFAVPIVAATGLPLGEVFGPTLDAVAEPKSETLRRALRAVAADDAAGTVMVGDRHHDVDAGRACGTATVGVTWGIGDADELAEADRVIDTPGDLVATVAAVA